MSRLFNQNWFNRFSKNILILSSNQGPGQVHNKVQWWFYEPVCSIKVWDFPSKCPIIKLSRLYIHLWVSYLVNCSVGYSVRNSSNVRAPSSIFIWCFSRSLIQSRSWALLEKLPIVPPLKKFPAFYGTRSFITVFTRPSTGPYPEPDQSNPYHPILSL
jgi:hypothetical protein